MDPVGEEHNLLQRDLSQNNNEHDLLSRVNGWELLIDNIDQNKEMTNTEFMYLFKRDEDKS